MTTLRQDFDAECNEIYESLVNALKGNKYSVLTVFTAMLNLQDTIVNSILEVGDTDMVNVLKSMVSDWSTEQAAKTETTNKTHLN